ncbi:MAG: polysaccharide export protein [Chromatiales bacterium]|nr:polysaccharide export protein [Chromatiales bacterium]
MRYILVPVVLAALLSACAGPLENAEGLPGVPVSSPDYIIGPGDTIQIFVWRNPEVSITIPVRPDGKVSTPLVEDLQAAGLSPTQLARQVEEALSAYIREPRVTVIVQSFAGTFETQVRVVGEALRPTSISYRQGLTLLDAMITVGGLTDFAAGNRASIVRVVDGEQRQYRARLDDLLRDGDISANVALLPGDILIIPESWY